MTGCKHMVTSNHSLSPKYLDKNISPYHRSNILEPRSKLKSKNNLNGRRKVRIPKSSLSKYAEKNYHQFGRRHNLPVYSMEEVQRHTSFDDCWIIVDGLVLDVTAFLPYHPASYECI